MGLFFRKKTDYIKDNKDFEIIQFLKIEGLKQPHKKKYKPTDFVSPIFGISNKDEVVAPFINKDTGDIAKQFDFIRTNPMEDRTIYGEFKDQLVSNEMREKVFGTSSIPKKTFVKEETKEKEISVPFSGTNNVPKFDEVIKEEIKVEPTFKSSFESEPVEVPFVKETPIDNEKEVFEEIVIKKPEERLEPTFVEVKEDLEERPLNLEEELLKQQPTKPAFKRIRKRYTLPPYSIFSTVERNLDEKPDWLIEQEESINRTLEQFNVPGKVVNNIKGPTVTRHEIELEGGINVSRVSNLKDNLMMNLAAQTIRIEAPIPGKQYVGIELPNRVPEMVMFGNVISDPSFKNDMNSPLKIALGVNIDGKNIFEKIDSMPHGLVAGATNSGKSVCINTIIASLLMKNHPDDLKFIMVDPKMVELSLYNDLPHLLTPVITDAKIAATALNWAVDEMERRYKQFSEIRVRDIKSYKEKMELDQSLPNMPYIVIIIDELADLMVVASQDVENSIQRITAKARAAGIHLIVATQRPTTDVVKGTIKANIPTRVAFRVSSFVDSTTILDQAGAEQLLGKGDMLLKTVDRPMRLQGAYIKDSEIEKLTSFISDQLGPDYWFTHDKLEEFRVNKEASVEDELFFDVANYVIEQNSCSINSIQKQFNVGFNRAQSIVMMLEEHNIVSKVDGPKARSVLITKEDLEKFK